MWERMAIRRPEQVARAGSKQQQQQQGSNNAVPVPPHGHVPAGRRTFPRTGPIPPTCASHAPASALLCLLLPTCCCVRSPATSPSLSTRVASLPRFSPLCSSHMCICTRCLPCAAHTHTHAYMLPYKEIIYILLPFPVVYP